MSFSILVSSRSMFSSGIAGSYGGFKDYINRWRDIPSQIFLGQKNQYCETDYTTKCNLQIQCNPYQITNGIFHRTRRRQWHPTPVLLSGKSHGLRSLIGYSPWGRWELDTTEWLHFHFSLSCIGEGNGNPLQCSCLENLRDGGAWWAAVYGVAQSRTRLKWLSKQAGQKTLKFVWIYKRPPK